MENLETLSYKTCLQLGICLQLLNKFQTITLSYFTHI